MMGSRSVEQEVLQTHARSRSQVVLALADKVDATVVFDGGGVSSYENVIRNILTVTSQVTCIEALMRAELKRRCHHG